MNPSWGGIVIGIEFRPNREHSRPGLTRARKEPGLTRARIGPWF